MQSQDVEKLIGNGESETVEFKRSTGQCITAAKTLCGMLNGTGGHGYFWRYRQEQPGSANAVRFHGRKAEG